MDAFAVAVVAGLTLNPLTARPVFRLAFSFGLFQAMMPVIGWVAGVAVHHYIAHFDHWLMTSCQVSGEARHLVTPPRKAQTYWRQSSASG